MRAQLVESLVMGFLLDVGQLMHRDHAQKLHGNVLEQRGDANLAFGFKFVALHA
jgi:hypothetical protein